MEFNHVYRISQVFYNLIVNAIRYSPSQGVVTVVTKGLEVERELWFEISVKDHGIRISQGDQLYVFDYFYRGDKSRDKKSGGAGLGLAIVKQLVEIHGGRVSVESELGTGSIFRVLLPLTAEGV